MQSYASRAGRWPLALTLAALGALGACADQPTPLEPPTREAAVRDAAPERQDIAGLLGDRAHWADGYLRTEFLVPTTQTLDPYDAFNRSGGSVVVTKVAGTTGRYIATFNGLSRLLNNESTVHVSGLSNYGSEPTYCQPAAPYLASDKVEVRCFRIATGAPVDAKFSVLVTRNYADLAFAYAHRPNAGSYAPAARGSWNPVGTTQVARSAVGKYVVTFNGLAAELPPGVGGHAQVNLVGTTNAHCTVQAWGSNGTSDMSVGVGCYTAAGVPVDARFTVLFLTPSDHLAYTLADQPFATSFYSPSPVYSSNPSGGGVSVSPHGGGKYHVGWDTIDAEIIGIGNLQVTAFGGNERCILTSHGLHGGMVECFGPNGAPKESYFTMLLGS